MCYKNTVNCVNLSQLNELKLFNCYDKIGGPLRD